jgi:hypothetical protein
MAADQPDPQSLDDAVAARLAKLGALPVDTSRLDTAIAAQIPRRHDSSTRRFLRPLTALAAGIALVGFLAAAWLTRSGGEVLASPAQMAQVHQDIVANRVPVTRVDSIDEASRVLSKSWSGSPQLPAPPQEHVMACCMKSIHDKQVACVLLQDQSGTPITMTVARDADMRSPAGPTVTRGGITYHVQSCGALNMVTTERDGRWVCLIGELPQDKLIDLASRLQF